MSGSSRWLAFWIFWKHLHWHWMCVIQIQAEYWKSTDATVSRKTGRMPAGEGTRIWVTGHTGLQLVLYLLPALCLKQAHSPLRFLRFWDVSGLKSKEGEIHFQKCWKNSAWHLLVFIPASGAPAALLCASSFLHSSQLSFRVPRVLVLCSAHPLSCLLRPKPVFSEAGCGSTSFYIFGGKKQECASGKVGPEDR